MIDSYVLLTPILMLPVVALLAFVGCDWVLGLDRDEPGIPVLTATVGTTGYVHAELSWPADEAASKFYITRRGTTGDFAPVAEVVSPQTSYTDYTVTSGITYFYVVTPLGGDEGNTYASDEAMVVMPPAFVTAKTLGTPRNVFSAWLGIAIQVGPASLTVRSLGRVFAPGNAGTHAIKIVDAMGIDVPNAIVVVNMTDDAAGERIGEFRYAPLAAPGVTLVGGRTYYIVSQETMGQDLFYDNADTRILTSNVAAATASIFGNGTSYSADGLAGQAYGPVDFRY